MEHWLSAVRARDIDGIVSHYAPDIVAFDALQRLRFQGAEAYRKHWEACLALCPGPMIFEIHDLNIVAGPEAAFCHCLNRCASTDENGEEKASWLPRPSVTARRTVSGGSCTNFGRCCSTVRRARALQDVLLPELEQEEGLWVRHKRQER
ncbi:MAG TPA: nuclear transport factor 2 family protein [Nevskiales bacterium]|nr:nuclear transport factor 2 family protein [Nevskiales bacterium]